VDPILELHNHFHGRCKVGFGWGTLLTNDFRGCHPHEETTLNPLPLVCKVRSVNGRPAVKLSDNYTKAIGHPEAIDSYRQIFGTAGMSNAPVIV
jgi:nicotinate phosphoribosyltransferase